MNFVQSRLKVWLHVCATVAQWVTQCLPVDVSHSALSVVPHRKLCHMTCVCVYYTHTLYCTHCIVSIAPVVLVCRLEGGKYLITHKSGEPFVTLMRAVDGAVGCSAYNLQQAHSSIPQPPASGPVPWIPVDPAVVLPFHKKHGRVPCTFPPRQLLNVCAWFKSRSRQLLAFVRVKLCVVFCL